VAQSDSVEHRVRSSVRCWPRSYHMPDQMVHSDQLNTGIQGSVELFAEQFISEYFGARLQLPLTYQLPDTKTCNEF